MILRRITEHVRAQNWFAVALDFAIVVLGVFIGIQVSNWNDDRTDQYRESAILGTIYDELQEDRVEFASGKESAIVTIASAAYVLEAAGWESLDQLPMHMYRTPRIAIASNAAPASEPIALSEDQKQQLWSSIVVGYYPTPNTTSIDALIGAGRLDLITDEAVRRNLQEYRNAAISLKGSQVETIKEFRTIAVTAGQERGYSPFYRGAEQEFIEQVRDDKHLLAVIATQRDYAALHLLLIEAADKDANELLAQIRQIRRE